MNKKERRVRYIYAGLARFIGEDGSMGLANGTLYLITIKKGSWLDRLWGYKFWVWINGGMTSWACPYGNFEKVKENWGNYEGQIIYETLNGNLLDQI